MQLAYWDGKLPALSYYAVNLGNWNKTAVLTRNSEVTAFIDNTEVFTEHISRSLAGAVDVGTLNIGSGYTEIRTES